MTTINPATGNDLDAENLAKAIRQRESGGNYSATGDAGTSKGGYQFQSGTWKQYAKEVLGDSNAEMTPQNQNAVAYGKIKKWKDDGKNAAQIAAMWNAGEGIGDNWQNHKGDTKINGQVIHYDTPQYVKDVTDLYQQEKSKTAPQQIQSTETDTKQEQPKKDLLQKTGDVVNAILPGKQVGDSIGTLAGLGYEKLKGFLGGQDNSKYYDTSAPTPLQVAGDIGQGALMIGTGLPEGQALSAFGKTAPVFKTAATGLGRIAQNTGIGAGLGLTGALKEGKTNVGDIAKDTAIGGTTGGILGAGAEAVSKIAENLPQRIVGSFIKGKGMGDSQLKYAIDKGLSSPSKMITESESSIKTMGDQLGTILRSPEYADFKVPGSDIAQKVVDSFPDANLSIPEIFEKIKSIVPLKAGLVDKLAKGELTLQELHTLNSALGKNTFKTVFDGVEVKANKDIGSAVYHSISDIIKNVAPETKLLFENLSKEYPLNAALNALISRGEKTKLLTLRDLASLYGGFSLGGIPGAISAYGVDKLATNPTVNLKTAGLINKLTKQGTKGAVKAARAPVMKGLIDTIRQ